MGNGCLKWLLLSTLLLCQAAMALDIDSLRVLKDRYEAVNSPAVLKAAAEDALADGELLILDMYLGKYHLGSILGIKDGNSAKLSLADISRALDFPIEVTLDPIAATGWLRAEENRFSIVESELGFNLNFEGKTIPIPLEALTLEDDLYISSQLLDSWFALRSRYDFRKLRIDIETLKPIPLEQKLARQQRAQQSRSYLNTVRFPTEPHDYQQLSAPLLDLQLSTTTTQDDTKANLSMLGANDLSYLNVQYFLALNEQGDVNNARLLAERLDPQGSLPGSATAITFGDIYSSKPSPLSTSLEGIGLRMHNFPLNHQFGNEVELSGSVQPGWDVEVYRNNLLIDSQLDIQGGEYRFQQLPLLYGANNIEIVLYGPQGQIERRYDSYFVGAATGGRGRIYYDFSINDQGQRLIEETNNSVRQGLTLSALGRADLTDWFSVNVGARQLSDSEFTDYNQEAWGTRTSLLGVAMLQTDSLQEQGGSYEDHYQLTTGMDGQSLNVSYRDKEVIDNGAPTLTREIWQLRLNGYSKGDRTQSWEQSFEYIDENNISYGRYTNQFGWSLHDHYFSHQLILQNNPVIDTNVSGEFNWQTYWQQVFSRFTVGYDLSPNTDLTSWSIDLNSNLSPTTSMKANYTDNLALDVQQGYISLGWRPSALSLSARLGKHSQNGVFAALYAQTSIGKTPQSNLFTSNRSLVNRGSVAVRVFHDKNNNQIYDADDQLLPGVLVKSIQQPARAQTDKNGVAVLASIATFDATDIEVDTGTIADLFLMPGREGLSVSPRPGAIQLIDMPMVTIGEIEGFINKRNKSGTLQNAAYVPISVYDESNQLVSTTMSEFDGYYLISDIKPGRYRIEIDSDYLSQHNLLGASHIEKIVTQQNPLVSGANFILREPMSTKQFATTIGRFKSLASLKLYWQIKQQQVDPALVQNWFYTSAKNTNDHLLHLSHHDTKSAAQERCQRITNLDPKLTCEVTEVTLQ